MGTMPHTLEVKHMGTKKFASHAPATKAVRRESRRNVRRLAAEFKAAKRKNAGYGK